MMTRYSFFASTIHAALTECRFYYAHLSKMPFYCSYKIWPIPMVKMRDPMCTQMSFRRHQSLWLIHLSKSNLDAINSALTVVTPISGPLAPVVASVGLSVMFAKWLSDMYASTYVPTYKG